MGHRSGDYTPLVRNEKSHRSFPSSLAADWHMYRELKEALGLFGVMLGLLLSSPHLSKALLRIPFGAWVDEVGGRKPFLVLLGMTLVGMGALAALLFAYYPHGRRRRGRQ